MVKIPKNRKTFHRKTCFSCKVKIKIQDFLEAKAFLKMEWVIHFLKSMIFNKIYF